MNIWVRLILPISWRAIYHFSSKMEWIFLLTIISYNNLVNESGGKKTTKLSDYHHIVCVPYLQFNALYELLSNFSPVKNQHHEMSSKATPPAAVKECHPAFAQKDTSRRLWLPKYWISFVYFSLVCYSNRHKLFAQRPKSDWPKSK